MTKYDLSTTNRQEGRGTCKNTLYNFFYTPCLQSKDDDDDVCMTVEEMFHYAMI